MIRSIVPFLLLALGCPGLARAADLSVCAAGCQYTTPQAAIDAAGGGDTILLRAGETFVTNLVLRAKSGTAFITIRSDAAATALPAAGVRLVPEGKPGANTARSALARLVGQGGTYRSVPIVRTASGAHHYRLQFLDIDGTANAGYETLVSFGVNDATQTTIAAAPTSLVLDRVWIHGHPAKGAKRGLALNSRATDVLNSYIDDIVSLPDAQGIAGFNGPGPFRIVNNYIEAGAENILFGGADPRIPDLVPADIEIRGNHLSKSLRWRDPILAPPASATATAGTGGALPAGTHYFKVVAVLVAGADVVQSAPSPEIAATVAGGGSVHLAWAPVAGAEAYRVYRGARADGESVYTGSSTTAMTYTGATERAGTPPSSGRRWTVKNLIEFKSGERVVIDGNLLEHNWSGFQDGAAVLFTPRNQGGTAPATTVRDVTFSNNIVRRVGGGISMHGYDVNGATRQARGFRIVNNVFDQVGGTYGQGRLLVMTSEPASVTMDHNTVIGNGPLAVVSGSPVVGFVWTNNFAKHNQYGIYGQGRAAGLDTLTTYFPGYDVRGNVFAGGRATAYPSGSHFPTTAVFDPSLADPAGGDYSLVAGSPYRGAATDGADIGVDSVRLAAAQAAQRTDDEDAEVPGPIPPTGGGALPTAWTAEDVGAVARAGTAGWADAAFTITGEGDDIWGRADAFRFVYQRLAGDGTIVARVAAVSGADPWAKAGVMFRAGTSAGAAHGLMLVSRARGTAFQRRRSTGADSVHAAGGSETAPVWVRLVREGNSLTAHRSADGSTWQLVGRDTVALGEEALVGLAVTGHGSSATARFDNVTLSSGTTIPAGWSAGDVGAVGRVGAASYAGGTFTVTGAGADIWGTRDAFQFLSRPLAGDGAITARVAAVAGGDPWTKVGVMMRQSRDAGSAHAFMLVSAGRGLAFQRRTVTGASTTHTAGPGAGAPRWVRLTRSGTTITAAESTDGVTWRTVGYDTFSMVGALEVGLVVSSHEDGVPATGTFDDVRVSP